MYSSLFTRQAKHLATSPHFARFSEWQDEPDASTAHKHLAKWPKLDFRTRYEILQTACRMLDLPTPAEVPDSGRDAPR